MEEQLRASRFLNSAKQYEAKNRPKTKKILAVTDGPLALTNGPLALTNGPAKRRRGRPTGSKNKKKA